MPPSATRDGHFDEAETVKSTEPLNYGTLNYLLDRDVNSAPRIVESSKGSWIKLKGGQAVFDATGGAAVSCLGHQNVEVQEAMIEQMKVNSYCHSMFFKTESPDNLAQILIEGTGHKMAKAFICCSGT